MEIHLLLFVQGSRQQAHFEEILPLDLYTPLVQRQGK